MPGDRHVFSTAMSAADRYRWESQWTQAAQEYRRALAEFPDDATARGGLGFCYMQLKQWKEALEEYEQILHHDSSNVIALSKTAELYVILNRREEAYKAYLHLADLYAQAGQGARAEAAWQKAVQLSPDHAEPHERLANYYFEKKDIAALIQQRLAAARCYLAQQQLEQARLQCEEALRADGANTQARQLLAQILDGQRRLPGVSPPDAGAAPATPDSPGGAAGSVTQLAPDGSSAPAAFTGASLSETVTTGNTSGGNTGIMGNMGSAGNIGGAAN